MLRSRAILLIFTICLSFILLQGCDLLNFKKLSISADEFVGEFYKQAEAHNYNYIYDNMCSKQYKDENNFESFERLLQKIQDTAGNVSNQVKGAWSFNQVAIGTFLTAQYEVTRTKGSTSETFVLKKNNDSWKIISYTIDLKGL